MKGLMLCQISRVNRSLYVFPIFLPSRVGPCSVTSAGGPGSGAAQLFIHLQAHACKAEVCLAALYKH